MAGRAPPKAGADAPRQLIKRLLPAQLLFPLADPRRLVDEDELDARDLGEVAQVLRGHRVAERGVVRAPRADPRAARGLEVRAAAPDGPGDRQARQGLGRFDDIDLVDD